MKNFFRHINWQINHLSMITDDRRIKTVGIVINSRDIMGNDIKGIV